MTRDELHEAVAKSVFESELWPGAWKTADEAERNCALYKTGAAIAVILSALIKPTPEMIDAGLLKFEREDRKGNTREAMRAALAAALLASALTPKEMT